MKKLIFCIAFIALAGCTENVRSKKFGGNMTVQLPEGAKLVNATWKDASMWYLTRPMRDGEHPETLTFQESSNFGIMNGTVIFVEHEAAKH